jgi:hypothetical protein
MRWAAVVESSIQVANTKRQIHARPLNKIDSAFLQLESHSYRRIFVQVGIDHRPKHLLSQEYGCGNSKYPMRYRSFGRHYSICIFELHGQLAAGCLVALASFTQPDAACIPVQ